MFQVELGIVASPHANTEKPTCSDILVIIIPSSQCILPLSHQSNELLYPSSIPHPGPLPWTPRNLHSEQAHEPL